MSGEEKNNKYTDLLKNVNEKDETYRNNLNWENIEPIYNKLKEIEEKLNNTNDNTNNHIKLIMLSVLFYLKALIPQDDNSTNYNDYRKQLNEIINNFPDNDEFNGIVTSFKNHNKTLLQGEEATGKSAEAQKPQKPQKPPPKPSRPIDRVTEDEIKNIRNMNDNDPNNSSDNMEGGAVSPLSNEDIDNIINETVRIVSILLGTVIISPAILPIVGKVGLVGGDNTDIFAIPQRFFNWLRNLF